jgi:hypothetical protein
MGRHTIILVFCGWLCGCGGPGGRMDHPEDPQGRYREQIAAARALLEQREDWASRAEWEVVETGDGWQVIAWRVERPDRKGAERYLPWGYSEIELDRRLVAVHYHRKG